MHDKLVHQDVFSAIADGDENGGRVRSLNPHRRGIFAGFFSASSCVLTWKRTKLTTNQNSFKACICLSRGGVLQSVLVCVEKNSFVNQSEYA